FCSLHEAHRNPDLPAFLDNPLQSQIVALFSDSHPLKSATSRLQGLSDRIHAIDEIHEDSVYCLANQRFCALSTLDPIQPRQTTQAGITPKRIPATASET